MSFILKNGLRAAVFCLPAVASLATVPKVHAASADAAAERAKGFARAVAACLPPGSQPSDGISRITISVLVGPEGDLLDLPSLRVPERAGPVARRMFRDAVVALDDCAPYAPGDDEMTMLLSFGPEGLTAAPDGASLADGSETVPVAEPAVDIAEVFAPLGQPASVEGTAEDVSAAAEEAGADPALSDGAEPASPTLDAPATPTLPSDATSGVTAAANTAEETAPAPEDDAAVGDGAPDDSIDLAAVDATSEAEAEAEAGAEATEDPAPAESGGTEASETASVDATEDADGPGEAAEAYVPPANAEEAEAREETLALDRRARREIQRRLTLIGHSTRGIDGIFGPNTRAAIAEWQVKKELPETGFLDAAQRGMLNEESASAYASWRQRAIERRREAARAREDEEAAARAAEEDAANRTYTGEDGCPRFVDGSRVPGHSARCDLFGLFQLR